LAGIGFELKKVFKKNSVVSKILGASYAATITIGPLILIIVTLFLMYAFLGYSSIAFVTQDLLASTILYVFIFALCTTGPFNAVISRYISDKIYENSEEDILPCYYTVLTVNTVFSALIGIGFCLYEYFVGNVEIWFVFASFCMYITLVMVFINMTFILALKEYRRIILSFVFGLLVSLILGLTLVKLVGVRIELAIVVSFAVGFLIIGFCLFGIIRNFFKVNSRKYTEVFGYFKIHWRLLLSNLFYTLGLYCHNFVFWNTALRVVVAESFVSAPVYDMATCIAMFINISTSVIFIVAVETNFHDAYQEFCQAIIGGTGEDVYYAKREMFRAIKNGLVFTIQLQLIFTISLFFLALFALPFLSITGLITSILPTLTVGYFLLFIMYDMIIFIYYFNVYNKAVITSALFLGITLVGSIFSSMLTPALYGLGVLLGALAGFLYAFFAIKNIEKKLEYYTYCKGELTHVVVNKTYGQKIYENKTI
jgi:uncharacterized membrane protein